jgi:DNA-binding HxlR family transcriptional regulator
VRTRGRVAGACVRSARQALDGGGAGDVERWATGFRALARAVEGISDSVLSERLGELTDAGLVTRTVAEGPPLSVTYALTDAGRALMPALAQISRWAEEHLPP